MLATTFAHRTRTLTRDYPLLIPETRIARRRAGLSIRFCTSRCPSSSTNTQGLQTPTIGARHTIVLTWTARTVHTTTLATMISLVDSETITSVSRRIAFLPSRTEKFTRQINQLEKIHAFRVPCIGDSYPWFCYAFLIS